MLVLSWLSQPSLHRHFRSFSSPWNINNPVAGPGLSVLFFFSDSRESPLEPASKHLLFYWRSRSCLLDCQLLAGEHVPVLAPGRASGRTALLGPRTPQALLWTSACRNLDVPRPFLCGFFASSGGRFAFRPSAPFACPQATPNGGGTRFDSPAPPGKLRGRPARPLSTPGVGEGVRNRRPGLIPAAAALPRPRRDSPRV